MLVDPNFDHPVYLIEVAERKKRLAELADAASYYGVFPEAIRVSQGVYEAHVNYNHDIDMMIESEYPFDDYRVTQKINEDYPFEEYPEKWGELMRAHWEMVAASPKDYGMCDNWEQIISKWPQLISSERKFLIFISWIDKNPNEKGGFRPHKWGSYIGVSKELENYEYLADCPDIAAGIWVFSILEIKDEYVKEASDA